MAFGATAGTIKLTTDATAGTAVRILLNAQSATSPVSIDWGNGTAIKYTVDPSTPSYNRWIDGTIEGNTVTISGNVTEADLNELQLTGVEIENMSVLRELDLAKKLHNEFRTQNGYASRGGKPLK